MKHYINNGKAYSYEYDTAGNISKIQNPDGSYVEYTYDSLNQLVKEEYSIGVVGTGVLDGPYTSVEYAYDSRGNLLSKIYSDGTTIAYNYTDTKWKDRLTAFNGTAITYDEIGTPLSWHDGSNMTWQRGRQLASFTRGDTTATYAYDVDGIRTSKTVNGVTTTYTHVDGTLRRMTIGNNTIEFYDNSLLYNGTEYWYVYNAQNDVIGLIDASGNYVVEYTYDSWGQILSTTGSMADTLGKDNPFRYRGYIYDEETGWYYCQSRYYDPVVGRWLNSDTTNALTDYKTLYSNHYNLYAYCINNPVKHTDWNGQMVNILASTAVAQMMAAIGASNFWNPIGIAALIASAVTITVAAVVLAVDAIDSYNLSKKSKTSGKERATDKPSWVNKDMVDTDLSAEENARKILNDKWGKGNWKKGPTSDYSKIKKWLHRDLGLPCITENDDDVLVIDGDIYVFDFERGGIWRNGIYYSRFD